MGYVEWKLHDFKIISDGNTPKPMTSFNYVALILYLILCGLKHNALLALWEDRAWMDWSISYIYLLIFCSISYVRYYPQ